MINDQSKIVILSGDADWTRVYEEFTGKKTDRAITRKLRKERSVGLNRWARAIIYTHQSQYCKMGIDFETGIECTFPEDKELVE